MHVAYILKEPCPKKQHSLEAFPVTSAIDLLTTAVSLCQSTHTPLCCRQILHIFFKSEPVHAVHLPAEYGSTNAEGAYRAEGKRVGLLEPAAL